MTADAVVRARIDGRTKKKATKVLSDMGLSVSDAIRLMLVRVAADKALPFEVNAPNAESLKAIAELERGEGQVFNTVEEFLADLNARD
jgi:DNA-damage-inducible protein J